NVHFILAASTLFFSSSLLLHTELAAAIQTSACLPYSNFKKMKVNKKRQLKVKHWQSLSLASKTGVATLELHAFLSFFVYFSSTFVQNCVSCKSLHAFSLLHSLLSACALFSQ